jgi:nitroreductase
VLRQRSSVRDFDGATAGQADIAALLAAAGRTDRLWPGQPTFVHLAALCWRVRGLEQATYQLAGERLTAVTPLATELAADLAVQPELAAAPVWLVAIGDLAAAEQHYGGGAYRALLLAAGSALQHAWLAATARGLAGVMFAGLRASQLRQALGAADAQRRGLAGLALGTPAHQPALSPSTVAKDSG